VITAHAQLRSALARGEKAWDELLVAYEKAVLAVLVDLRRVHRRGRVPPKDRLPSLSDVMSVSSPAAGGRDSSRTPSARRSAAEPSRSDGIHAVTEGIRSLLHGAAADIKELR
jgi:hypothetical protein